MKTRAFTRGIGLLVCMSTAVGACGEDGSTGPEDGTGAITVAVTTTNNLDPDGFLVSLDGAQAGVVPVDGSLALNAVPAGRRAVALSGIASNCVAEGGETATVDVAVGEAATVTFAVACTDPPEGRIYYLWHSSLGSRLHVVNADGTGKMSLLSMENGVGRLAVSHDGSRLAFTRSVEGRLQLFVVGKDGSGLTQVTSDAHAYEGDPAWSPDGTRIAFLTGEEHFRIATMAPDGSDVRDLTGEDEAWLTWPDWSPDGSRILFSRQTDLNSLLSDTRIWVANADGSDPLPMTDPAPLCDDPAWGAGWALWHDFSPQWSPDGSRVLFTRYTECDPDPTNDYDALYVMNADGSELRELMPNAWRAAWSPDGSRIAFREGHVHLSVMDADGSGVTRIVEGGTDGNLGWIAWGR